MTTVKGSLGPDDHVRCRHRGRGAGPADARSGRAVVEVADARGYRSGRDLLRTLQPSCSAGATMMPLGAADEQSPAEIDALDARWSSCWTPTEVAHHLTGTATPSSVPAGWALDLFRGRPTREHAHI